MTERLLQFIWQFQYFNKTTLKTVAGESLEIIHCGQLNTDQGPDFSGAKIRINETTWVGMVELHMLTSEWTRHGHQHDKNYAPVVLHVVWEDDSHQNNIPVLELKDRVSKLMLNRYTELMNSVAFVPCEQNLAQVKDITWKSWKDRLVAERLNKKSVLIEDCLKQNNFHWEETFWWLLARNFGIKVNGDAFEAIARSIQLPILAKHKNQLVQLEAMLFGQANLLHRNMQDSYARLLYKEYQFLKKKYGLKNIFYPVHFLRMRPGNFPTLRLAQLAALISSSAHLFSRIRESISLKEIIDSFNVTANDYWFYHYRFDTESEFRIKNLGKSMINNLVINTVVPVLFTYGKYTGQNKYQEKAIQWLEETAAEKNRITNGFEILGLINENAFDSQALLELKKEYCDLKKCLGCTIGNVILRTQPETSTGSVVSLRSPE